MTETKLLRFCHNSVLPAVGLFPICKIFRKLSSRIGRKIFHIGPFGRASGETAYSLR